MHWGLVAVGFEDAVGFVLVACDDEDESPVEDAVSRSSRAMFVIRLPNESTRRSRRRRCDCALAALRPWPVEQLRSLIGGPKSLGEAQAEPGRNGRHDVAAVKRGRNSRQK